MPFNNYINSGIVGTNTRQRLGSIIYRAAITTPSSTASSTPTPSPAPANPSSDTICSRIVQITPSLAPIIPVAARFGSATTEMELLNLPMLERGSIPVMTMETLFMTRQPATQQAGLLEFQLLVKMDVDL